MRLTTRLMRSVIARDPYRGYFVSRFHRLFYYAGQAGGTWRDTYYMGARILKCPTDLWVYQEILYDTRPDLIVETGTAYGGSALYFAHLLDLLGAGRVVTVDIAPKAGRPEHPRVTYLTGSSTSPEIVGRIQESAAAASRVMVVLDSDHTQAHVLAEMRLYSPLVTPGCYMVVEDTNINGRPVLPRREAGPWEAVDAFLREDKHFSVDRSREKFLLTFNPRGYLKKNLTAR